MANNQLLASDSFQRADNISLGANWTTVTGAFGSQIVSHTAEPADTTHGCNQVYTAISWPTDQISEITLGASFVDEPNTAVQCQLRFLTATFTGYLLIVSDTQFSIYRYDNISTNTLLFDNSGYTIAAGDVITFQAAGAVITVYQNYKFIASVQDATYTAGGAGFGQYALGTTIAHAQIASWRGYSCVQQDGIWQKQGIVLPAIASELGGLGTNGTQNPYIIQEAGAQILSGTVFKMWFQSGADGNTAYAESVDGLIWTRYSGNPVVSGAGICPAVIKVGSTYYLFAQPDSTHVWRYHSSDGLAWTRDSTTILTVGTAGAWDDGVVFYFSPIAIIAGTWYAMYTGARTVNALSSGLATSSDGLTWTKYASNPVVSNFWGIVQATLINGVWWAWGQSANLGQGSGKPGIDPGEGQRMHTVDFIHWLDKTRSAHHSQMFENVNGATGGNYVSYPVNVNGRAYLYSTVSVDDVNAPETYQIEAAIGPASIASIVTQPEDGLFQTGADTFTRADGSLGANWVTPTGGTALQIVSDLVEATTTGADNQAVYVGSSFGANQYSSVRIAALGASSFAVPIARASTSALTYYEGVIPGAAHSAGSAKIIARLAGVATQIGPTVTVTPEVGDSFILSAVGNVISLFQNEYLVLQVQDASIASGAPGMLVFANAATSDVQIDRWTAGNAGVIPNYSQPGAGAANFVLLGCGSA